jgi:dTMP kinase
MSKNRKPLFITFEGGEGSGKTTLINSIEADLLSRGYQVVKTREPGGTPLGDAVRQLLLKRDAKMNICTMSELLLFLTSRAQQLEEIIRPALSAGKIVLCDRFNDSTVAYQGLARNLGLDEVQKTCDFISQNTNPDLTLYLDIDPSEGLKRTRRTVKEEAGLGEMDRIENEKLRFHKAVRQAYKIIAKKYPNRIHTLDGSLDKKTLFAEALKLINSRL